MKAKKNQWYEYQVGLYVAADSEAEAFEKLQPLLRVATELDEEGDAEAELVAIHPWGGPRFASRQ